MESYKHGSPFYMMAQMQNMIAEQDEEDEVGPKRRLKILRGTKWHKATYEGHMERFRQPDK